MEIIHGNFAFLECLDSGLTNLGTHFTRIRIVREAAPKPKR
jgi:hypothetical protein